MQSRIRAIVLRVTRYRDADLIVHLLTEKGQSVAAMARSALKSKKRFGGGVLEPTRHIEAVLQTRSQEADDRLVTLSEAQLVDPFDQLRSDYTRLQVALEIVGLVDKMLKPGDSEQVSLFNLVGHSLRRLETHSDPSILKMHFQARLLDQQGVLPHEAVFEIFLKTPISSGEEIRLSKAAQLGAEKLLNSYLRQYVNR